MSIFEIHIKCTRCGGECDPKKYFKFDIGQYKSEPEDRHTWSGQATSIHTGRTQVNSADHAYCQKCYDIIRNVLKGD